MRKVMVAALALLLFAGVQDVPLSAQSASVGKPQAVTLTLKAPQLLVTLKAGASIADVVGRAEAQGFTPVMGLERTFVLRFLSTIESDAAREVLLEDADVTSVELQFFSGNVKKATNDTFFAQQFYLRNTGTGGGVAGMDVNAEAAWALGFQGSGIRVAVVDDGVQFTHPDLIATNDAANSTDIFDNDSNPGPTNATDDHGTRVAGLIGATADNNEGIAGIARSVSMSAIRLLGGATTAGQEAAALTHNWQSIHIYSNSWGAPDNGFFHTVSSVTANAIRSGTTSGRSGLGNIYVWAGGNGRASGDYSSLDGLANLKETITVGSISRKGLAASYSEAGPNIFVVAPGGEFDVYTTDLVGAAGANAGASPGDLLDGNYTNSFAGTSASTPMVSAVVALMLDANEFLGWRDVQHILARSSRRIQPNDTHPNNAFGTRINRLGWQVNGAGMSVSHQYGFGLVDAAAAVQMALEWSNVPAATSFQSPLDAAGVAIPDSPAAGISRTINVTDNLFAEHVEVTISSNHTAWSDLSIRLTSPAGTEAVLTIPHSPAGGATSGTNAPGTYTFTALPFWGESTAGDWTLVVQDLIGADSGTLLSWRITAFGTVTEVGTGEGPTIGQLSQQTILAGNSLTITGENLIGATVLIGGVIQPIAAISNSEVVINVNQATPNGSQILQLSTIGGSVTRVVSVVGGSSSTRSDGGGGGCALLAGSGGTWGSWGMLLVLLSVSVVLGRRMRRASERPQKELM